MLTVCVCGEQQVLTGHVLGFGRRDRRDYSHHVHSANFLFDFSSPHNVCHLVYTEVQTFHLRCQRTVSRNLQATHD